MRRVFKDHINDHSTYNLFPENTYYRHFTLYTNLQGPRMQALVAKRMTSLLSFLQPSGFPRLLMLVGKHNKKASYSVFHKFHPID